MEIKRIVRMTFQKEKIEDFLKMFNERKLRIRNFPGCLHLELWQDKKETNAFFTYSIWESEEALNHYRFSEFFKETWSITKTYFNNKPEAWTIEMYDTV